MTSRCCLSLFRPLKAELTTSMLKNVPHPPAHELGRGEQGVISPDVSMTLISEGLSASTSFALMSSSVIGCEPESAYERLGRNGVRRGVNRAAERNDWEAASRRDMVGDLRRACGS